MGPTQKFGRYQLLHRVARGGMGEVYLARLRGPAGFEKLLIIKRILGRYADNPEFVDMFFSEARLAAKLTHRNIAQIFDMGKIEGSYYLAMEHVYGVSLRELIQQVRRRRDIVPAAHIIDLVGQVCEGLAYAHAASDQGGPLNLVHRDVNPSNILVSYAGEAKIIDFGIAKSRMQVQQTGAGVIKGKLAYMSPEQATARRLDRRSDIFSLGVCLYELCTLEHPFWREDRVMTFDSIQRQDPRPLGDFDRRLVPFQRVVDKALAKNPSDRYASAALMRRDLHEILVRGEVSLPPDTLSEYLHVVLAEDIASDNEWLRGATGLDWSSGGFTPPARAVPGEPDDDVPPALVESTALSRRRALTSLPAIFGHVRPRLIVALLLIVLATALASMELYALGRRHRDGTPHPNGTPNAVVELPLPSPAAVTVKRRSSFAPPAAPDPRAAPAETPPRAAPSSAPETSEPHAAAGERAYGTLEIRTSPTVAVTQGGKRVRGRVILRSESGTLVVGSGRDAKRDPFAVTLSYTVGPGGIEARIDSTPRAILQDERGSDLGTTGEQPVTLAPTRSSRTVNLVNAAAKRRMTLVIELIP